jgi:hypothetical protein
MGSNADKISRLQQTNSAPQHREALRGSSAQNDVRWLAQAIAKGTAVYFTR